MTTLLERLSQRNEDIRVGVIGIGSIGSGLTFQSHITPGMDSVAIADIHLEKATDCLAWMEREYQIIDSVSDMEDVIQQDKVAVCEDGLLIAQCAQVDVLIEASNSIAEAALYALEALAHGKHVIMMNYEADLTFGPLLQSQARQHGLVYTVADGDQPAAARRVINDMQFWGFELVMAGNIKGYLDRYANPTSIIPEADKRGLDYQMAASYTDGTKLCVEMAVLANGLNLRTHIPGMRGPRVDHVLDIFDHIDFPAIWASGQPVVDYVLGAKPKGGVFAVGYSDKPYHHQLLDWYPPEMGPGPFYIFYRPYHLGSIEAMMCVAQAVLDHSALLQPEFGFKTNVFCYAKRDLVKGETLDGIGGYCSYGQIENLGDPLLDPGIPICLSDGMVLNTEVPKDQRLSLSDVRYDLTEQKYQLFAAALEQSALLEHRNL